MYLDNTSVSLWSHPLPWLESFWLPCDGLGTQVSSLTWSSLLGCDLLCSIPAPYPISGGIDDWVEGKSLAGTLGRATVSYFSHYCDQIPDRKQFKEGRVCLGSPSEGTIHHGGKAWWQVLEAAGHVAPAIRKQREMDAGAQLPSCSLLSPRPEWDCPHSG